jgi:hypothetical protein
VPQLSGVKPEAQHASSQQSILCWQPGFPSNTLLCMS